MRRTWKKWLSGLLALCVALTLLPGRGFAAEREETAPGADVEAPGYDGGGTDAPPDPPDADPDPEPVIPEPVPVMPVGDNLWAQLENGVLTIGCIPEAENGIMDNFNSAASVPWFANRESIQEVVITPGVTSISAFAFWECTALAKVTIPDTVTQIGNGAFTGCSGLSAVYYSGESSEPFSALASHDPLRQAVTATILLKQSHSTDSSDAGFITLVTNRPLKYDISEADIILTPGVEGLEMTDFTVSEDAEYLHFTHALKIGLSGIDSLPMDRAIKARLRPSAYASYILEDTNEVTVFSPSENPGPEDPGPNNPSDPPEDTEDPVPSFPVPDFIPDFTIPDASDVPSVSPPPEKEPEDESKDGEPLDPPMLQPPPEVFLESPIQSIIRPDRPEAEWVDRAELPQYSVDLYNVLVTGATPGGSDFYEGLLDCLVQDEYFAVDPDAGRGLPAVSEVEAAETLAFTLLDPYAGGDGELSTMAFSDDDFASVDTSAGDKTVDYAALQLGDVVKTPTFNGIFVTSVPRDGSFEAARKEATSYAAAVFHAFDRDHPEVFWLSGKLQIRTVTVKEGGGQTAYIFLTLADNKGFTMRAPDWTKAGAVAEGIRRREEAVEAILSQITAGTPDEKLRQLNRYLTEHNEYNTSPDLTAIGNEPHECLSALEGRGGKTGPVCDGYSRAFKLICDRLDIDCVLESGYAKTSAGSKGSFHMWNSVQVGREWYGVDVTWNDPSVKGGAGVKSGRENENYLLVGSGTEIRGMAFSASHPVTNYALEGGVDFYNSPALCAVAFSSLPESYAAAPVLPFADVPADRWYYDAVDYVYTNGLMTGTSDADFSPDGRVTRAMLAVILHRMAGQPAVGGETYADVPGGAYYADAVAWARSEGILTGYPDGTFRPNAAVTRQQLAVFLYRFARAEAGGAGGLELFTDGFAVSPYAREAMAWAVARGLLTGGADGRLLPEETATRAQTAAVLMRLEENAPAV